MSIQKVSESDYLIKVIDDTIRDLQLRKSEIIARMPKKEYTELPDSFVGPTGKVHHINRRKRA